MCHLHDVVAFVFVVVVAVVVDVVLDVVVIDSAAERGFLLRQNLRPMIRIDSAQVKFVVA